MIKKNLTNTKGELGKVRAFHCRLGWPQWPVGLLAPAPDSSPEVTIVFSGALPESFTDVAYIFNINGKPYTCCSVLELSSYFILELFSCQHIQFYLISFNCCVVFH